MLKKSIQVRVNYDEDLNLAEDVNAYNPFKRGVMEFDDYNYAAYNPYVLVEDPKFAEPDEQIEEVTASAVNKRPVSPLANQPDDFDPTFSQKNLTNSVTEEYEHPLVTIEPSDMEVEKARIAREFSQAEQETAAAKALEEAKKKKIRKEISSRGSDEEEKTVVEGEEGEGEGEGEDQIDEKDEAENSDDDPNEFKYRVFYKKEEIRITKHKQD